MFQRPQRNLDELNRTLMITGIAALLAGMFFQYGTWPKTALTAAGYTMTRMERNRRIFIV